MFQLVNGGNSGSGGISGDGDASQILKEACEYHKIHNDFSGDQISALLKLYPDLSFNELPRLCQDNGKVN